MKKLRTIIFPIFLSLCVLLFSCVSQHRLTATQKKISIQDSLLQIYNKQLTALNDERKQKLAKNLLDDTANSRISQFIDRTQNEISELHKESTVLIGEVEVNKDDWDKLRKNLSACLNATK